MNTEPMDEWVDYAKRSGLLDASGVAPDPSKAQTAWFAFTYAWNRRSALTASEAPATEQAPPLPEPAHCDVEVVHAVGDYRFYTGNQMRARDAMWMAKIAALRSEQAPAGEVPSNLLAELDWCIENGNTGPRSHKLLLALRAALSTPPAVPPGHVIVPVEPTDEMLRAAQDAWLADPARKSSTLYRAMLSAAPTGELR